MTVLATSSLRYIQIHLMLLFICQEKKHPARESAFKYISCYCLSLSPCNLGVIHSYSNTSHVIVYRLRPSLTFQEIYIQIHLMLLFIVLHPISFCRYLDSNTSHVIVYLAADRSPVFVAAFKYISCYCLSWESWQKESGLLIQIHLMLLFIVFAMIPFPDTVKFKYISCYCLSVYHCPFRFSHHDSNTSHVIVYPLLAVGKEGRTLHSNTSHVIVYHAL